MLFRSIYCLKNFEDYERELKFLKETGQLYIVMKHGKKKNFKGDTEFKPIKPFNGFRTTTISLPPPQTLTLFLIYAVEVTYCHFDTALYVTKNENTQLLGVFKCKRGINLCSYMVQLEVVNKK